MKGKFFLFVKISACIIETQFGFFLLHFRTTATNQITLLTKKRTKVEWTGEEISEAFTWRYLSPSTSLYEEEPLFPLPG